ncbi:hypothetical protein BgiBS90_002665, partial [Biomphalaria glabrata]
SKTGQAACKTQRQAYTRPTFLDQLNHVPETQNDMESEKRKEAWHLNIVEVIADT